MNPPKLLLIGWDAADWRVINPLIKQGKMPALESLLDDGCSANISTLYPALSPMLWTSIATGKRAWKHGILGFTEPEPNVSGIRPITNLSRKTKAVWNILNQNGYRCNVVGWWPSHPSEPIDGVMISNHYQSFKYSNKNSRKIPDGSVYPRYLSDKLEPLRIHPTELDGEAHLRPFVPLANEINQSRDTRLYSIANLICDCTNIHSAATALLQNEPADFMAVYFDAIDHFSHGFMKYHPPRIASVSEDDFKHYHAVVEGAYRYHDMMLERLLQLVGDDCTIMLMSDHGFHPDHLRPTHIPIEPAGPSEEHRSFGIFVMKGPGIKRGKVISGVSLLDIAPTVLQLFDLAVGEDMDGTPIWDVFDEEPLRKETLPSWDDISGPHSDGCHPVGYVLDPIENAAMLDQMVELGYIEPPKSDQEENTRVCIRELRYNLARSYMDGSMYGEASSIFEELWEAWPDESRFGLMVIRCQLMLKNLESAWSTFEKVKLNKERYAAVSKKELKKERDTLRSKPAEEITPVEKRRLRELQGRSSYNPGMLEYIEGVLHIEAKQFREALLCFEKAESMQFVPVPLAFRRGECFLRLGHLSEAEASFIKVLQLDSDHIGARLGLSQLFLNKNENYDAAAHALKATQIKHWLPEGHYLYGAALHQLGKVRIAVNALQTCIEQTPNHYLAHKRLASIYEYCLEQPKLAELHNRQADQILENDSEKTLVKTKSGYDTKTDQDVVTHPGKHHRRIGKLNVGASKPREVITVVSGLPRSGTSMMMQVLERGGLSCLVDDQRKADSHNPQGYYEFEPVKSMHLDATWMDRAKGKAIKIVAPLLLYLPDGYDYRVLFMIRNLDSIVNSQQRMIQPVGNRKDSQHDLQLKSAYAKQIWKLEQQYAENPRIDWVYLEYETCLKSPEASLTPLSGLVFPKKDLKNALSAICPEMCHFDN